MTVRKVKTTQFKGYIECTRKTIFFLASNIVLQTDGGSELFLSMATLLRAQILEKMKSRSVMIPLDIQEVL